MFGRSWWNEQGSPRPAVEQICRARFDEHPNARRATLTSPACNGLTCPTVWASPTQRTFGNSLFVNLARIPFVLSDAELQAHGGRNHRMVTTISGCRSRAWNVVRAVLRATRHPVSIAARFIICSYEFVSVVHRRILARVFMPVFNLYASPKPATCSWRMKPVK